MHAFVAAFLLSCQSLTAVCMFCHQLDVSQTRLSMQAVEALAAGIAASGSVTSVNVLSNRLDLENAELLLKVKAEKPKLLTLCGLTHNETTSLT